MPKKTYSEPLTVSRVEIMGVAATLFCADQDARLIDVKHALAALFGQPICTGDLALIDADDHPTVALIVEQITNEFGTLAVHDPRHGHFVVTHPGPDSAYRTGDIIAKRYTQLMQPPRTGTRVNTFA